MASEFPNCVLLFSGKRKSGKDYVTNLLLNKIGPSNCVLLHLSGPLKEQYAKEHGLDLEKLMDSSEYKEQYRENMIHWGEKLRNTDPDYFCRLACSAAATLPIWIVVDARRPSDVFYFKRNFGDRLITIRVYADSETRLKRGWIFTAGIDDAPSECALDNEKYDFIIDNSLSSSTMNSSVLNLLNLISVRSNLSIP